jgi:type III restriction enzyme
VVCNNTSASKLVYDFISGYERDNDDSTKTAVNGRLELFRNYDDNGNRMALPRTLLIDSEQLESGDALDDKFRNAAPEQIEQFKREIIERTGNRQDADNLSDAKILREVMNTVGRKGKLGESIRCVVSVSMLTEGWDANTVTHVLGVRAFGTQLLCEQVIGRALRRLSYDLNEDDRFNVEYADVLGIPFNFMGKPVVTPPQPPRRTVRVQALPEREHLAIEFPRVLGYRVEPPNEVLHANFSEESTLVLTPELTGPTITHNSGIIGEAVDLTLHHLEDVRPATVAFQLAKRLAETKYRDDDNNPKLYLFPQLKTIATRWLTEHLLCKGNTFPAQLMYLELADMACERITAGITRAHEGENPVKVILDPYNPTSSTAHVNFNTSVDKLWTTNPLKCHINLVVLDSDWEAEFCRVVESHPKVYSYAKNHNLWFEVPYPLGTNAKKYRPDFIVLIDDGHGPTDLLRLVVEIKGYRGEDAKIKRDTIETYWVPGVNNANSFGRWAFAEFTDVFSIDEAFNSLIAHYIVQAVKR